MKSNIQYQLPTISLLVIGIPKSGTTIISSVLGAHPDINMVLECPNEYAFRMMGKKFTGNKLCIHNQIMLRRRNCFLGKIINRIVNCGRRPGNWKLLKKSPFKSKYVVKLFPDSKYSVIDYVRRGTKFIVVSRNRQDTINSLIRRKGLTYKRAQNFFDRAYKEKHKILEYFIDKEPEIDYIVVNYEHFVNYPFDAIRRICHWLDLDCSDELIMRMIENGSKYNLIYPDNKKLLRCAESIYVEKNLSVICS